MTLFTVNMLSSQDIETAPRAGFVCSFAASKESVIRVNCNDTMYSHGVQ